MTALPTRAMPGDDPAALAMCQREVMREVAGLIEYAGALAAKVGPPIGRNSRRYLESAVVSIQRTCEYIAVSAVLARHWDAGGRGALAMWMPRDLLANTTLLAGHPMPFPVTLNAATGAMSAVGQPVALDALVKLYARCGVLLHIARPDAVITGAVPSCNLDRLRVVVASLRLLVNGNAMMLPNGKQALIWSNGIKDAWVGECDDGSFDTLPALDLDLGDDG